MSLIKKILRLYHSPREVLLRIDYILQALGRIEAGLNENKKDINQTEFKVYSQWGEDGIIQYLIQNIEISNKIFIEFGVENYTESNTRFLLQNNNWSGLVIDGSESNIEYIKNDPIYWRYNLKVEAAFIDKDNINTLIKKNGIKGDIGILSVDIDGNDYWVWESIDCISPRIVICEYNSVFGPDKKVTTPYRDDFVRSKAHYTNVYYGSSISALNDLAERKGYSLVYGNKNGNNVFFVRNDLIQNFKKITPQEAYIRAQFREARDIEGNLTFLSFEKRVELVDNLNVHDLNIDKIIKFKDAK